MAPLPQNKSLKDQKLKNLLSFARSLTARLEADVHSNTLRRDLRDHVKHLPLDTPAITATKQQDLDTLGTELWNLSTRLHREDTSKDKDAKQTLCLLRAFSFLLLDTGQQATVSRATGSNAVRVLKVALKAAKFCVDAGELELALDVLKRAAVYVNDNEKGKGESGDEDVHERLRVEYYVLRTAHAWKDSRIDVAENMFTKIGQGSLASLDPAAGERYADVLYEIGKDFLRKKQHDIAVRWLERSHDALSAHDLDQLSADAGELRLSIFQSLVKALHALDIGDSRKRAWDLVRLIESDFGDKMVVSLLKLEMMSAEHNFDTTNYSSTLLRMVPSLLITDANFKTLMHHVHHLKSKEDTKGACNVLDELISQRLFETDRHKYLEKACITRIWISSQMVGGDELLASFTSFLNLVKNNLQQPFTATATHAAQTLLWRKIETSYSQQQYGSSHAWCTISLHPLFENAGDLNKAKIARKMILCSLALHDHTEARRTYFSMSDTGKAAGITQYLMYKVALRSNQNEQATEYLDAVCQESKKDATILYACVLEAQQAGDKRQATIALQKVVERYNYKAPEGVHLAILLRCAARLLVKQLETEEGFDHKAASDLAKLYQGAAKAAREADKRSDKASTRDFTLVELEWFSKTSYNLALKHCADFSPETLGQLLLACVTFVELLEAEAADKAEQGLLLRKIFCHYLTTTAYLTMARSDDVLEKSLENYLSARKHAKTCRALVSQQLSATSDLAQAARDDLIAKHAQILTYELEALLKLSDWPAIDALLDVAFTFDISSHLSTLADLILLIQSTLAADNVLSHSASSTRHHAHILTALQKVINAAWKSSSSTSYPSVADITKLARWIRCLFQIALHQDDKISLQCVDQAAKTAGRLRDRGEVYPRDELEWLATTAFNRSVDAYCAGDDDVCRVWAEKAIGLAKMGNDEGDREGGLHGKLLGNYSKLRWERVEQ